MNAVRRIIGCYFRYVKGCFTMADVVLQKRAFFRNSELLAYNAKTKEQFHVENSVTHSQLWSFSADNLHESFDRSFRGLPANRQIKDMSSVKEEKYFKDILKTYRSLGFSPSKVKRIFVVWRVKPGVDVKNVSDVYHKKHGIRVEILSFRDQILSSLQGKFSNCFYHDEEVLGALSLIAQRDIEIRGNRSVVRS